MAEFIHARCGGRLVPIPRPHWDVYADKYARCDRCHLPGIVGARRGNQPRLFTDAQADAIREHYFKSGLSHAELGVQYGVSERTIQDLVRRQRAYAPEM